MKSLTYIELDIPVCSRAYGVAPCTASIGVTGARKCFNTKATCQDRDHYDEDEVTLRFGRSAIYYPDDIPCIPSILEEPSFTPATISLGENLGTRATLQVTFGDHPDSDTWPGLDPYHLERDYDPFLNGTFFGKFRARQPFLRGRSIRWKSGVVGDAIEDLTTRHFIVESFDGPTPDGKYTLIAKDVLKLADGDRAQVPAMNNGFLVADITSGATSATLSPSGIGDLEYPTAGYAVIGGKEIVFVSRSGDVLTLGPRANFSTTAQAHKAQDRVQFVQAWVNYDPANIVYDMFIAAGVPAGYMDVAAWQQESAAYLGRLYTAYICEPTSVATLASEIIQQACLSVWWDDVAQQIRLKVLRGVLSDAATFSPENTLQGSLTVKEQPEKRVSQVWTYFGQINPLRPLSDTDNYRSTSVMIDQDAEDDYGSPAIKKIYSRFIPALGRTIADRVGEIHLGRFRDPPRRFTFDTQRYADTDIELGIGYKITGQSLQDEIGARIEVPVQVTRLNSPPDRWRGEAEEILFNVPDEDLTNRLVLIDANINNVNLRDAHDSLYPAAVSGDTVTCEINTGVIVGSTSNSQPALDIGSFPAGVTVVLKVYGRIQGRGGKGGIGGDSRVISAGADGGPALYTRQAITLSGTGQIWGGGGGGGGGGYGWTQNGIGPITVQIPGAGGGGGGGGAGQVPGEGSGGGGAPGGTGSAGGNATTDTPGFGGPGGPSAGGNGGPGGYGGAGGNPGSAGSAGSSGGGNLPGSGAAGGAAGKAIDGVSYITGTVSSILGPQVN